MEAWNTCVANALLGSDRQAPQLDAQHPALAAYVSQLQSQPLPQQLLASAGLLSLYAQAGQRPAPMELAELPVVESCALTICATTTAEALNDILKGTHAPALPELLSAMIQAQQTPPPELLPRLLESGRWSTTYRPMISLVLGARGLWLARQNPNWEFATGATLEAEEDLAKLQNLWETGNRKEREAALIAWRRQQPDAAREAVLATWKQDNAAARATWVAAFTQGLSLGDEEFLEQALSDRGQAVRRAAAELLGQLVGSRFMQQMADRAQAFIQFQSGEQGLEVVLQLPKKFDPAWGNIGIWEAIQANTPKMAASVWWVTQMLMSIDLNHWSEPIPDLIAAIIATPRTAPLLNGLASAAQHQNRLDWFVALLTLGPEHLPVETMMQMIAKLPPGQQEQSLQQVMGRAKELAELENLLYGMNSLDWSWSPSNSQTLIAKVWEQIKPTRPRDRYQYYRLEDAFKQICYRLHLSVLPQLQAHLAELTGKNESVYGIEFLQACLEILEFRQSLQAVFGMEKTTLHNTS
jgi:Family of unknown function (DUF5691)